MHSSPPGPKVVSPAAAIRDDKAPLALVAVAAIAFALASTSARVAYDGGSDVLSVTSVRTSLACLAVFTLLRAQGVRLRLAPRDRSVALALGLVNAAYSYALYAALAFVPVAVATLIFYTYPLLVGAAGWTTGREPFAIRSLMALVGAFGGLALMLHAGADDLALAGILLAGLAAILCAFNFLVLGYAFRGGDSRVRTLYMLFAASFAFVTALLLRGHFTAPEVVTGWIGLAGTSGAYAIGTVAVYAAVARLGPVRVTTFMNLEPVAAIAFGALLLGQYLPPGQSLGAASVIGALLLAQSRKGVGAPRPIRASPRADGRHTQ